MVASNVGRYIYIGKGKMVAIAMLGDIFISISRTCCEPLGFKKLQNQVHPYVAGSMRAFQLMSCRATPLY